MSTDGRLAVSASWDKTLRVWDLASGRVMRTLKGHSAAVECVAVSPDGQLVASASQDETLTVWKLDRGEALATFACNSPGNICDAYKTINAVRCCMFIDSSRIIAGDNLGRIHLLQLEMPQ